MTETGALPGGVTFAGQRQRHRHAGRHPDGGHGGTYALTITAANGVATDATQSFTLTVDQAPAITSATSTTFTTAGRDVHGHDHRVPDRGSLSETGACPRA